MDSVSIQNYDGLRGAGAPPCTAGTPPPGAPRAPGSGVIVMIFIVPIIIIISGIITTSW